MYQRSVPALLSASTASPRSEQDKEERMKVKSVIVTSVIALGVFAPTALGALDWEATVSTKHVKSHHAVTTAKSKTGKSKTAAKAAVPRPPIYIYAPGPVQAPAGAVVDPTTECTTYGNDCTDQQACEYWGMNCDQVGDQSGAQTADPSAGQ
jgi:hypothetical protein